MKTENKQGTKFLGLLFLATFTMICACTTSDSDGNSSEESPSQQVVEFENYFDSPVKESIEVDTNHEDLPSESEQEQEEPSLPASLISPMGATLETRVLVPEGYTRVTQEEGSFGNFIRSYPMKEDLSPVLLYDGSEKKNQGDHVAVFQMAMVSGDLQQCADSIMRIYAEYFLDSGQADRIKFHFVSGFLFDYPTYRDGGRISISGNSVSWVQSAEFDDSYETFEKYLKTTFNYASTLSMEMETSETTLENLQIGDLFIYGGSPGHVCMVADVCEKDGKKAFLLAQGYMPAQEFHLLKNPAHEEDPWYYEEEVIYPFVTPEYTFQEGSLRHPEY